MIHSIFYHARKAALVLSSLNNFEQRHLDGRELRIVRLGLKETRWARAVWHLRTIWLPMTRQHGTASETTTGIATKTLRSGDMWFPTACFNTDRLYRLIWGFA